MDAHPVGESHGFRMCLLPWASAPSVDNPKSFLATKEEALDDVRYEIAVTARACSVLDAGSVQLEEPIPDAKKEPRHFKNSDVYGTFQKVPVRIEVTVLHERLERVDLELDDVVKGAKIPSGFRIMLRSVITDRGYAERVRALVELLHECHVSSGGKDEEIDGIRFGWRGGAYHCRQETSPFESICFCTTAESKGADAIRDITHHCSVRSITPKYVLEDNPNPPEVFNLTDIADTSNKPPVSTKIRQMLDGKLQQCERGVINIVAFGNPLPMHDRELVNAVRGAEVVMVPCAEDSHGIRRMGTGVLQRLGKAPFMPAADFANDEDRWEFVDPFRKMSAIWHVRVGSYAESTVIPNPNALCPVPEALVEVLSGPAPRDVK